MEEIQVKEGAEEQAPEPQLSEIEGLRQTVQQKETEIKRLQGILKVEQKRGGSKAELETITKRLDAQEEWLAEALDDLARRQDGSYEEPRQERKSYKQSLTEKRQAGPSQPLDPEVKAFFDYIEEHSLTVEDDIVKEALAPSEDRTPKQAMKFIKEKLKSKEMSALEQTITKREEEKSRTLMEQRLKDLGYTAEGVLSPGAPAKDLKSMTPDEKLNYGFSQMTKKK